MDSISPTSFTVASGGGTATFEVKYTPTAGAFSFELDIANNDGDENPYDIEITGTGVGGTQGDVNGDGTIDAIDVRLCLQISQGVITGTTEQREAADVDSDGDVDMDDARILAEFIIGMRTTLP